MAMSSTSSHSLGDGSYPPLPENGPPEDSDLAQKNFTERERLSKSWRARLFTTRRAGATLLEKRSSVLSSDSDHSSVSNRPDAVRVALGHTEAVDAGPSQPFETFVASQSTDTGRISLNEVEVDDPTKHKHLYRWAMVYENQRGISLFSTRRYSSQSLLPRDPPPYSIASPSSSLIEGRPVRKSQQPDISLEDFPLPDGNWRWASKEWMVDMREGTVQHDGFEYNWFFRSKGWRSTAGRLNAGAWVRRRRWLRLMERPPIDALQQGKCAVHIPQEPTVHSPPQVNEVWRGDEEDWSRMHRIMRELGRDGRKLEMWEEWIAASRSRETEGQSNRRAAESMGKVVRDHMDGLLRSFVFPSSRITFLKMVTEGCLLSESEVLDLSALSAPFVDRPLLAEALTLILPSEL